jgi:hypothetical protein
VPSVTINGFGNNAAALRPVPRPRCAAILPVGAFAFAAVKAAVGSPAAAHAAALPASALPASATALRVAAGIAPAHVVAGESSVVVRRPWSLAVAGTQRAARAQRIAQPIKPVVQNQSVYMTRVNTGGGGAPGSHPEREPA